MYQKDKQEVIVHSIIALFGFILIIISIFSLRWIHLVAGTIILLLYGGLNDVIKYVFIK